MSSLRLPALIVALIVAASSCGARTGLDDRGDLGDRGDSGSSIDGSIGDATGARDGAFPPDAPSPIGCPPLPIGWTAPRMVATSPNAYSLAANPRCGVVLLTSDVDGDIDIATLDAGGAFVHQAIEASAAKGQVVAAALTDTTLHILYNDGASLRYLSRRGGVFSASELVDAAGLQRGEMVVDATSAVHVIYVAALGAIGEMRYAVRRGAWSAYERVDSRPSFEPTIALGKAGDLYASYQYVSDPSVHACVLATRSAASASWSLLDISMFDDHWSSSPCNVRSAPDGTLHLGYGAYGDEGYVMRHAYGLPSTLRFETIDKLASFGTDPAAAAIDSRGALHVAYRGVETGMPLKTGVAAGGTATILETVPDGLNSGGVVLTIDGVDVTHLVFYRAGNLWYTARAPD